MKTKRKLERDQVVEEAVRLLDEEGFDGLTLRRLASRLNVQAPSLYWHFADRMALLWAMVDALDRKIAVPAFPVGRSDLLAWFCERGVAMRNTMRDVRDSARLLSAVTGSPEIRRKFEQNYPDPNYPDRAKMVHISTSINSFVLGWLLSEQEEEMLNFLTDFMDVNQGFELALRGLGRGLIAELGLDAAGPEGSVASVVS